MPEQAAGVDVRVAVGLVGHVVALALEEAHELDLPPHRCLRHLAERPVEGDPVCARAVEVVEALAAPAVVRFPRVDRDLDEEARSDRLLALTQNEEGRGGATLVRPVREDRLHEVVAARPVRVALDRVGHGPAGTDRRRGRGRAVGNRDLGARLSLLVGVAARDARDEPRSGSSVPAEPVDGEAIAVLRADVDVDVLSRCDADLGSVEGDAVARAHLPRGRAGQRVLALDGGIREGGRRKQAAQKYAHRRSQARPQHPRRVVRGFSSESKE